jgi:hypothetical protein
MLTSGASKATSVVTNFASTLVNDLSGITSNVDSYIGSAAANAHQWAAHHLTNSLMDGLGFGTSGSSSGQRQQNSFTLGFSRGQFTQGQWESAGVSALYFFDGVGLVTLGVIIAPVTAAVPSPLMIYYGGAYIAGGESAAEYTYEYGPNANLQGASQSASYGYNTWWSAYPIFDWHAPEPEPLPFFAR